MVLEGSRPIVENQVVCGRIAHSQSKGYASDIFLVAKNEATDAGNKLIFHEGVF